LFDNFFSNTWSRLGQGWRPDIKTGEAGTDDTETDDNVDRDRLDANINSLWENLDFCAFLLEREITHSALKTLSTIVLTEKGAMPVGEIGKMLQEATTNPTLSNVLKEQFGGLKKFLERYPEVFLISVDHPFNPYVYLRSQVSETEAREILNGTYVRNNITTSARKRVKKKKKGEIATPSSSSATTTNTAGRQLSNNAPSFHPKSLQM